MKLEQLENQNKDELSLIEVAHAILQTHGDIIEFTDLLVLIQNYLELTETQLEMKMTRFYTDLNIDGRFISLGENRWGLRSWYPIDSINEETIASADDEDLPTRPRKKKGKMNVFEDEDMIVYGDDDPEDSDEPYEDEDEEDEEDEEETEDLAVILAAEDKDDDEDEDEELNAYASDLSELGEDDIDLDEDEEFEDIDEDLEEDEEELDEDE